MTRTIGALALAVLLACGGGGSGETTTERGAPRIELVTPADGGTIQGDVDLQVRAIGDGVAIERFVFTRPADLTGAVATFDPVTHRATLSASLHTRALADGPLQVSVAATDANGRETSGSFTFQVSSTARLVDVDGTFQSYRSEVGLRPEIGAADPVAVPGTSVYGSPEREVVRPGSTVHKSVTRMAWTGSAPNLLDPAAAAELNLPTLRLTVPQEAGDPPIAAATATVRRSGGSEVATFDLLPAGDSAGQRAYLLPLASNLIPFLARLTEPTDLSIEVSVTDGAGHVARGNGAPWTVRVDPLPPPLAVRLDPNYSARRPSTSVWAYQLSDGTYAGSHSPAHFSADGARIHRILISNADRRSSVAVDLSALEATWTLAEEWVPSVSETSSRQYVEYACSAGGSHGPCDPRTFNVCIAGPAESTCTCRPPTALADPGGLRLSRGGALAFAVYAGGSPAARTSEGAWIVPAATATAPGVLEVFVHRQPVTDRGTWPALSWSEAVRAYSVPWSWYSELMDTSVDSRTCEPGGTTSYETTYTWRRTVWSQFLHSASEAIAGSLATGRRALDEAGTAYGPVATENVSLQATVAH